jgi:hypothetical protein
VRAPNSRLSPAASLYAHTHSSCYATARRSGVARGVQWRTVALLVAYSGVALGVQWRCPHLTPQPPILHPTLPLNKPRKVSTLKGPDPLKHVPGATSFKLVTASCVGGFGGGGGLCVEL